VGIILLALAGFFLTVRQRRKRQASEVGDPYGVLYPGREEKGGLRREGRGSAPSKRAGELGEDGQIGVQPNPIDPPDAQRQ
jgi:hypothetical protein